MPREADDLPKEAGTDSDDSAGPTAQSTASELDLDLTVERIDTEGVLKEGFSGQEM